MSKVKLGNSTPQEPRTSEDDPKFWVPNAETKADMEAARRGETGAVGSSDALFHELNAQEA